MVVMISGFLVFFVLVFLVVFYYCLFWDFYWCFNGKVRCWVRRFECGFVSQRFSEDYFRVSFFLLLVFFVVFDLEVSLLLKVPFEGFLFKNLVSYFIFVVCLVFGYVYEIESGFVTWDV